MDARGHMSAPGRFRALRPECLAATGGNACAALMLDLFAYWTQVRASNAEQARSGGKEGNDLWFYRSLTDISADLFGAFGRAAIRSALKVLEERGLIESRTNPASPWDRTLQYRLTEGVGNRILQGAKPDDVQDAKPDDDARARPSRPSDAQSDASKKKNSEEARAIFAAWVKATGRDPSRTQHTPDRQRCIATALASHGFADCLAAVQHIGADAWARGDNDRGQRFDDVQHALGKAERIERWRDQQPRSAAGVTPIRRNGKDREWMTRRHLALANGASEEQAREFASGRGSL